MGIRKEYATKVKPRDIQTEYAMPFQSMKKEQHKLLFLFIWIVFDSTFLLFQHGRGNSIC